MAETVPAAVIKGPGVVDIDEFPMPGVDAESGLLRVEAAGIVGADYEYYAGKAANPKDYKHAIRFPYIPGHIITGRIEKLGARARQRWHLDEGDRVLLQYNVTCGHCPRCQAGEHRLCENLLGYGMWFDFTEPPYLWGGAAQFMMLHPNTQMVKVPPDADLGSILLLERLADASNWLQHLGGLTVADSVVILGTGALAQAAVTVARFAGARPVIAVARAGSPRADKMRVLGADHVLTGSVDENVAAITDLTGGRGASLIVDLTTRDAFDVTALAIRALGYRGRLVQVAVKMPGDMRGIRGSDMIQKELTIIGVKGHDLAHLRWAAQCVGRPEFQDFLSAPVARYELANIKAALDNPPAKDGAALAAVFPNGLA